jgi:Mn2+/Fe2+ NRAMP family transporter
VPLSTAYSVSEAFAQETGLDDGFREAPFFYCTYVGILGLGAAFVLVPGAPLVRILFLTQVLNAVLLLPLLVALRALGRSRAVMGEFRNGPLADAIVLSALTVVALSVIGLAAAVFL